MKNYLDRKTLKEFFETGKVPTAEQFAEFIDSVPNIKEDKSPFTSTGKLIASRNETDDRVLEIYYREPEPSDKAVWKFTLDENGNLAVSSQGQSPILTLTPDQRILLSGSIKITGDLQVSGFNGSHGISKDGAKYLHIPADGHWHSLPIEADKNICCAYRVIANLVIRRSGRSKCYLVEATVSDCKCQSRSIFSDDIYWGMWNGGVKFRWKVYENRPYLQIRSRSKCTAESAIYCQITQLWNQAIQ